MTRRPTTDQTGHQEPIEARMARLEHLLRSQQDVIARQQERIEQLEGHATPAPEPADMPAAQRVARASSRRTLLKLGGAAAAAGVAAAVTGSGMAHAHSDTPTQTVTATGAGNIALEGDGTSSAVGLKGTSLGSIGVWATSDISFAMLAQSGGGVGIQASSTNNNAVVASSTNNIGVVGTSTQNYGGTMQGGLAPLFLWPSTTPTPGPPSSSGHQKGELYVDIQGTLWYCISNAPGPSSWIRVSGPQGGVPGGVVNFLSTPIRIFDSRSGQPAPLPSVKGRVPANTVLSMQVTGTIVNSISVPAGAVAVIANATAVSPSGPGFLSFWPNGQPFPGVSNLNYVGGQIVPNFCVVGLDANGQMAYEAGGGSDTDMLFDVAGYVL